MNSEINSNTIPLGGEVRRNSSIKKIFKLPVWTANFAGTLNKVDWRVKFAA